MISARPPLEPDTDGVMPNAEVIAEIPDDTASILEMSAYLLPGTAALARFAATPNELSSVPVTSDPTFPTGHDTPD